MSHPTDGKWRRPCLMSTVCHLAQVQGSPGIPFLEGPASTPPPGTSLGRILSEEITSPKERHWVREIPQVFLDSWVPGTTGLINKVHGNNHSIWF